MVKLEIKSDQKDVSSLVKSAIFAEIKRMEIGLNRTEQEIKKYEKKYQINSDVFLKDFTAEDLNDGDNEYIKWAGEIKLKERILDDLSKLQKNRDRHYFK
jgi:predicted DNA-binding protein YlxM (UPF0122 family)